MNLKEAYNEIIESNLGDPEDRKAYLQDLTEHGAISGMVGGLIYYHETTEFFDTHKDEIVAMLDEMKEETGLYESKLFGDKWRTWEEIAEDFESNLDPEDFDSDFELQEARENEYTEFSESIDPLEDIYNKNLLSWFAMEELARKELDN